MSDIHPLTLQEVFNTVWDHATRPDAKQCLQENGQSCSYRNGEGNKCFIGLFIPDYEYSKSIDFGGVSVLLNQEVPDTVLLLGSIHKENDALGDLQDIHDTNAPAEWEDKLTTFATKYKLELPS